MADAEDTLVIELKVIDGFMAQTGDVENGNTEVSYNPGRAGTGGSDLPNLPAEFSKHAALVLEGGSGGRISFGHTRICS